MNSHLMIALSVIVGVIAVAGLLLTGTVQFTPEADTTSETVEPLSVVEEEALPPAPIENEVPPEDVSTTSVPPATKTAVPEIPAIVPAPRVFTCENDAAVQSRAYVVLLGLGDDDPAGREAEVRGLASGDPKTKAVLAFDYSKSDPLAAISQNFIQQFNSFVSTYQPEEVVIIGRSAGGTVASFSANQLRTNARVELHTLASPLRGYGLGGLADYFAGGLSGFEKEIAVGFQPFAGAPANFKIYHHKTVTDSYYQGRCGGSSTFCDIKTIQNNNLSGAQEFYYPEFDHGTIMSSMTERIVACHQ